MTALETIGREIVSTVADEGDFEFDPALILVIISIITKIFQQLDDCREEAHIERIKFIQRRRPLVAMWRLNRIIRDELGESDRVLQRRIKDALLNVDEVQARQAMEEVLS